jgi:uncharacterized protein
MVNIRAKFYTSVRDRTIGLIGQNKISPVLFFTRFGIHTFGLKFPIDVIILDKQNIIRKISQNLKPNSIFVWPLKYNKIIELPAGFVKEYKLKTGIAIELTEIKHT